MKLTESVSLIKKKEKKKNKSFNQYGFDTSFLFAFPFYVLFSNPFYDPVHLLEIPIEYGNNKSIHTL